MTSPITDEKMPAPFPDCENAIGAPPLEMLTRLGKYIGEAVYRADSSGNLIYANSHYAALLGIDDHEQFLKDYTGQPLPHLSALQFNRLVSELRAGRRARDFHSDYRSGQSILPLHLLETAWSLTEEVGSGEVFQFDSVVRVLQPDEHIIGEAQFTNLVDIFPGCLFQFRKSPEGHFSFPHLSDHFFEIFPDAPAEIADEALSGTRLVHPDDWPDLQRKIRRSARRISELRSEFRTVDSKGKLKWIEVRAKSKRLHDGSVIWVGVLTDISHQKTMQDEAIQLAFYDPLTGLANRRLLMDRLSHALDNSVRSGRHCALVFIDLDNFKQLNDSKGHGFGDMLLQQIAKRMKRTSRSADTIARFGGDEFVVLMEELPKSQESAHVRALAAGERILQVIDQPYALDDVTYQTTASVGITVFEGHTDTVESALQNADLAMYASKAAGKNAVRFFSPEMKSELTESINLMSQLRDAISGDQFCLHYQPFVNSANKIVGAEALVRWNHPEKGLIFPGAFIPAAEQSGIILQINDWVLKTAIEKLSRWAKDPDFGHLYISVNLSARQFEEDGFVERVKALLDEYEVEPQHLRFELTEYVMAKRIQTVIEKMQVLQDMGIYFSLDDFGTGYSSLEYLKLLPITQLKIDGSFVRDIETDRDDRAIVRTIIAMSQSLGLTTIAERVETSAQRDYLYQRGCRTYQGYLFSKPVPDADFDSMAKAGGGIITPSDLETGRTEAA